MNRADVGIPVGGETESPLEIRRGTKRDRVIALWQSLSREVAGVRSSGLLTFSAASLSVQGIQVVAGLLSLRWLRPAEIGLWQSLLLVQTYTQILQAGVLNGLNRELPFEIGTGNDSAARSLAGTARAVAVGVACLLAAVVPIAASVVDSKDARLCLAAIGIVTATSMYRQYLASTYRAEREFSRLAFVYALEAVAGALTIPIIYLFGLRGFAARFAALAVFGAAVNHAWRPFRRVGPFDLKSLRKLLATGVPIFAFGYAISVAETFPRLHLLAWGGAEGVGRFAPAGAAAVVVSAVCGSLAQFVYPKMSYRLGQSGDTAVIWRAATRAAFGVMAITLVPAIALVILAPWLLNTFFPAYSEAASSIRWMCLASLFLGMGVAVNGLLSLKAWRWMTIFALAKLGLYAVLPGWLLRTGGSMAHLAAGVACTEAAMFTIGVIVIRKASRPRLVDSAFD